VEIVNFDQQQEFAQSDISTNVLGDETDDGDTLVSCFMFVCCE